MQARRPGSAHPLQRLQQAVRAPLGRGVSAARDAAASELAAARDGLPVGPGGPQGFRKWLGWKLYHVATRVNPEIGDL